MRQKKVFGVYLSFSPKPFNSFRNLNIKQLLCSDFNITFRMCHGQDLEYPTIAWPWATPFPRSLSGGSALIWRIKICASVPFWEELAALDRILRASAAAWSWKSNRYRMLVRLVVPLEVLLICDVTSLWSSDGRAVLRNYVSQPWDSSLLRRMSSLLTLRTALFLLPVVC